MNSEKENNNTSETSYLTDEESTENRTVEEFYDTEIEENEGESEEV